MFENIQQISFYSKMKNNVKDICCLLFAVCYLLFSIEFIL
jgi:hypothetical protein